MNNQILIIENDKSSAQTIKDQLEAITNMKCIVAFELPDIHWHLQTNPEIEFIFLFYDVSDSTEQTREQTTKTYLVNNFPGIQIISIGSLKKEALTVTNQKIFIFNANDIINLIENHEPLNQKLRSKHSC